MAGSWIAMQWFDIDVAAVVSGEFHGQPVTRVSCQKADIARRMLG
jgi:hypothetical protein